MGLISNTFNNYGKWGATKFTDLFNIPFVNANKTDGLKWHLQEIRQRTYDGMLALEAGITANDEKISANDVKINNNITTLGNHNTRIDSCELGINANDAKITSNLNKIETLYQDEVLEHTSYTDTLVIDEKTNIVGIHTLTSEVMLKKIQGGRVGQQLIIYQNNANYKLRIVCSASNVPTPERIFVGNNANETWTIQGMKYAVFNLKKTSNLGWVLIGSNGTAI